MEPPPAWTPLPIRLVLVFSCSFVSDSSSWGPALTPSSLKWVWLEALFLLPEFLKLELIIESK